MTRFPFDAARPGRRVGRRLAGRDPIRPVGQRLTHVAQRPELRRHTGAGWSDRRPLGPDVECRPGTSADDRQDLAGRLVPDLVAVVAPLHRQRELELGLRIVGRLDHGQPPRGRVDRGGRHEDPAHRLHRRQRAVKRLRRRRLDHRRSQIRIRVSLRGCDGEVVVGRVGRIRTQRQDGHEPGRIGRVGRDVVDRRQTAGGHDLECRQPDGDHADRQPARPDRHAPPPSASARTDDADTGDEGRDGARQRAPGKQRERRRQRHESRPVSERGRG